MTSYHPPSYTEFGAIKFWLLCLCLLMVLQFAAPNAFAGDQANRAVSEVKKLIAEGKVPKDATLRIVAKEGNITNFWGKRMALKTQWEDATGTMLDTAIRPNLPVLDFMRQQKDFDITLTRQREYPDLYLENLVMDLTIEVYGGIADPFRYNHVHNKALWPLYSRQVLEILPSQFEIAVPAGTGLPGDAEYMRALNGNLWLAAQGKITAEAAMAQTAAQWEKITDKFGRRQQLRYWRAFKDKFPN